MTPAGRIRHVLAAAIGGAMAVSCGASIQAVYEGDVRFEHCMALDTRPDVKPTLRRGCWEEWTKFYTFGQTRDRIDYARLRIQQLGAASDFAEAEAPPEKPSKLSAVPEPTSVLAPPPMMLTNSADAGPADAAADAPEDGAPPASECTAACAQSWDLCRQECKSAQCEKTCTGKYRRCMKKCF